MDQNVTFVSVGDSKSQVNIKPGQKCRVLTIRLLVPDTDMFAEGDGIGGIADGISEMLSDSVFEEQPFVIDWAYAVPLEESPEYIMPEVYQEGTAVVSAPSVT